MDIGVAIIDFATIHDHEWFRDIENEFKSDKDYDSLHRVLRKEIHTKRLVDTLFLIPGTFDPNDPPVFDDYSDVEISLFWYCWHADGGVCDSKYIVLRSTLTLLIDVVADAISHSGDISVKYNVIMNADRLLVATATKMIINQPELYASLIKHFIYKFRLEMKSRFGNILWIYGNNEITVGLKQQDANAPEQLILIKRRLRKDFFEEMFNWHNEEGEPIVDHEYLDKASEYADILHKIYNGTYTPQPLKIDFTWEKAPVYYIISCITKTKKGLTLKKIIKCDVIRVNGSPLESGACRQGRLKFAKKNSPLKAIIDNYFNNEINRSGTASR